MEGVSLSTIQNNIFYSLQRYSFFLSLLFINNFLSIIIVIVIADLKVLEKKIFLKITISKLKLKFSKKPFFN